MASYVDDVVRAFANYTSDILVLIDEGNRVSGKQDALPRRSPQRTIRRGAERPACLVDRHADLYFHGPKVCGLYVLGDIYRLIQRLKG